jgi:hypothetical protein
MNYLPYHHHHHHHHQQQQQQQQEQQSKYSTAEPYLLTHSMVQDIV